MPYSSEAKTQHPSSAAKQVAILILAQSFGIRVSTQLQYKPPQANLTVSGVEGPSSARSRVHGGRPLAPRKSYFCTCFFICPWRILEEAAAIWFGQQLLLALASMVPVPSVSKRSKASCARPKAGPRLGHVTCPEGQGYTCIQRTSWADSIQSQPPRKSTERPTSCASSLISAFCSSFSSVLRSSEVEATDQDSVGCRAGLWTTFPDCPCLSCPTPPPKASINQSSVVLGPSAPSVPSRGLCNAWSW